MNKQNVKWHQLTPDAAVAQLHTNASCGLSRKEARSRYRKFGPNTLFDTGKRDLSDILKPILTDPACLILLLACVLALCFSEVSAGVTALICFFGGMGFVIRLLYIEKRLCSEIAKFRIPLVRVIRDGHEYLTSARNITPGDVICLKKGDVVPADCRLLAAYSLRVLCLQPGKDGKALWQMQGKNAERVYAYGDLVNLPAPENMLYGGSEIMEGEARAVITQIGERAFLGGIEDFELPAEFCTGKTKASLGALRPYLRFYGFALFILLLPLSVIGMLTAPENLGILRIFLALCALVCAGSQAFLTLHFRTPITHLKNERLRDIQCENRAVLKSPCAPEVLSSLTDILVMGHAASSDGKLHLYRLANGNGELPLGEQASKETLISLCEAFLLLQKANAFLPNVPGKTETDDPFGVLRCELLSASGYDTEAMAVRLLNVSFFQKTASGDEILDVEMKDCNYRLLFSDRKAWLSHCTFFEDRGKSRVLDFQMRANLNTFIDAAIAEGCSPHIVIRQSDNQMILMGIVALREQMQEILPSVVEELHQSGVCVSFFLPNESDCTLRYASAAGLSNQRIGASYFHQSGRSLADFYKKYRVFIGFSEKEIASLLSDLKRAGHRVAVLGNRVEELPLLRASSLSVSCDPALHHKLAPGEGFFDWQSSPEKSATESCPQSVRRHSDVLICRAGRSYGGLSSLLHTISDCRAINFKMSLILKFLLASAIPRLIFTLLSVCFGVGLLSGAELLFSGMLVETVGVLWLLSLLVPQNQLRSPLTFQKEQIERILTSHMILLPPILASLLTGSYSLILYFCDIFTNEICSSYLFCSMLLIQLTALILTALSSGVRLTRGQPILPVAVIAVPTVLFVAFSVAFPAVNRVLGLGEWNLVSFLSLLLPPVFYGVSRMILGFFFNRTAK